MVAGRGVDFSAQIVRAFFEGAQRARKSAAALFVDVIAAFYELMREQVMRRRLPLPITGMPTPKRAPMNMHPDRRGRIIMDTGCWECGANPVSFWNLPLLSNGAFAWYDDRPICSLMCLNDYVEAKSGVDLTLRSRQDRPEPVSNQCFLNHPRYERWHRPPLAATWTFQR